MYEEENRGRLRESVANDEEYLKTWDKKRKVENELRFFKLDHANMVGEGGGTFPVGQCKTGSY